MKIAAISVLALMAFVSSADAQAWRNCIQNSIGPGGCESIGPGGGQSIGPGGGASFGPVGGSRLAQLVASPLGQEGAYRSDPAAGSGLTEIGAGGSIPGT